MEEKRYNYAQAGDNSSPLSNEGILIDYFLKNDETYRNLFQNENIVVLLIDQRNCKIIDANCAASEFYGWTQEELKNMDIHDIDVHIMDSMKGKKDSSPVECKIAGDRNSFFSKHRLANDNVRDVKIYISTPISGECELHYIVVRDVTELKMHEKALEEEIKWRRNLMEQSRDGIVILDTNGKVFETNRAYARMLGYSMEEMQTLYVWDWDASYTKEQIHEMCQKTDENGRYLETKQRRKDGRIIDVEINSNSVKFADKKLILCICRDISERKQTENELLEAKQAAETASRAKDEFLSTMSHELRTPLNSILGFADILQSGSFGEINEMQAEYLSYISKSGKHLLAIINNILDLAKAESGKMKLNYEIFYIFEVLDEIKMTLEPLAIKKDIKLTIAEEVPIEIIEADKTKFKEIFYNLVSNAIKFTPEKGTVDVNFRATQDLFSARVKDTGIGIAKEDMDKLFQPFKQLNPYLNHEYEGTGLGLTITKKFVDMHGGNIVVKSKPGEGSEFIFTIPIKAK